VTVGRGWLGVMLNQFDGIDKRTATDGFAERRPSCVAWKGQRENVKVTLQRGQHELLAAPRIHESVQTQQRWARASAVSRREP
jgi:hypothetical protein